MKSMQEIMQTLEDNFFSAATSTVVTAIETDEYNILMRFGKLQNECLARHIYGSNFELEENLLADWTNKLNVEAFTAFCGPGLLQDELMGFPGGNAALYTIRPSDIESPISPKVLEFLDTCGMYTVMESFELAFLFRRAPFALDALDQIPGALSSLSEEIRSGANKVVMILFNEVRWRKPMVPSKHGEARGEHSSSSPSHESHTDKRKKRRSSNDTNKERGNKSKVSKGGEKDKDRKREKEKNRSKKKHAASSTNKKKEEREEEVSVIDTASETSSISPSDALSTDRSRKHMRSHSSSSSSSNRSRAVNALKHPAIAEKVVSIDDATSTSTSSADGQVSALGQQVDVEERSEPEVRTHALRATHNK